MFIFWIHLFYIWSAIADWISFIDNSLHCTPSLHLALKSINQPKLESFLSKNAFLSPLSLSKFRSGWMRSTYSFDVLTSHLQKLLIAWIQTTSYDLSTLYYFDQHSIGAQVLCCSYWREAIFSFGQLRCRDRGWSCIRSTCWWVLCSKPLYWYSQGVPTH